MNFRSNTNIHTRALINKHLQEIQTEMYRQDISSFTFHFHIYTDIEIPDKC